MFPVFTIQPRSTQKCKRYTTLLDDVNFVLRGLNPDGSVNETLWQSFDFPKDTLRPEMKLRIDFRTGHRWSLSSWISDVVPASGSFTIGGEWRPKWHKPTGYCGGREMSIGLLDFGLMDISLILIFLNYLLAAMCLCQL